MEESRTFAMDDSISPPLDIEHKFKLLEIIISEQEFFLENHHKRLQFYITLLSTVLAATIAGAVKLNAPEEYALLLIGPLTIFVLTSVGAEATGSAYQGFLETVTSRAKVEDELGITRAPTRVRTH